MIIVKYTFKLYLNVRMHQKLTIKTYFFYLEKTIITLELLLDVRTIWS